MQLCGDKSYMSNFYTSYSILHEPKTFKNFNNKMLKLIVCKEPPEIETDNIYIHNQKVCSFFPMILEINLTDEFDKTAKFFDFA